MRNGVFENTSAAMDAANEGVDQELPNEGSGASNEQYSEEISHHSLLMNLRDKEQY